MKHLITLLFVLISTQLWAAEDKQTYFCLSASDGSQKLLVLADVNGEQIGYLDTDEYKLNDENGVLVGPSKEGSSFFKLASGKLDLMSSAGIWSGVCHQFTTENAQALSNASKSGEVVVSDSSASSVVGKPCTYTNPKNCTQGELCSKATYDNTNGSLVWENIAGGRGVYVKEAKARGLSCGVSTASSSSNEVDSVLSDSYYKFSYSERRELQKVLKSNGYYKGPIDGAWDKATRIALKKELNHTALMKSDWWVEKELKRILTSASSSSSNFSDSASLSSLSNSELCNKATFGYGSGKQFTTDTNKSHLVREAKARNIKCGVSVPSSTYNLASSKKSLSSISSSASSSTERKVEEVLAEEFYKFSAYERKLIQNFLKSKGRYYGSIDGIWGEKTERGLRKYFNYSSSMRKSDWVKNELQIMISLSPNLSSSSSNSNNTNAISQPSYGYKKLKSNPYLTVKQALEVCKPKAKLMARSSMSGFTPSNTVTKYNCTEGLLGYSCSSSGNSLAGGVWGGIFAALESKQASDQAYDVMLSACMSEQGYAK